MRNGHLVIDSDGHAIEPADLWDRYIDRSYYDARPIGDPNSIIDIDILGHRLPTSTQPTEEHGQFVVSETQYERQASSGYDVPSYLEALDSEGIDSMVLFPSRGLYATSVTEMDGGLSSAISRGYNRWIAEYCSEAPDRLKPVGILGLHDPGLATKEAVYAVEELGAIALMVRPNPYGGRNLDHRDYDELYAEITRMDVPLGVHEGSGIALPQWGCDRFDSPLRGHALCHPAEQMGAVMCFTMGVMARHPKLRVAFLEAGGGWLPYWLARLDEHWKRYEGHIEIDGLELSPTTYFKRQGWIGFEADEPNLDALVRYIGNDRILWASDFPHVDATYPGMVDDFFEIEELSDADRRMIGDQNPQAFFRNVKNWGQ
jgi:predicted TIM-barrel fold metal-dependent hydrolase